MISEKRSFVPKYHRHVLNMLMYMWFKIHYGDVIMSAMASKLTGVSPVCSTVCSCADQRKNQSSASLAFVQGIHRWPVNSSHKGPVTRKMFPFDDVIMFLDSSEPFQFYGLTQWGLVTHTIVLRPRPSLVAIGLSVGYEAWPHTGWHRTFYWLV